MQLLLNQVLGTIFQLFLFTVIPFGWWRIHRCKEKESFGHWLGLKRVPRSRRLWLQSFLIFIVFALNGYLLLKVLPQQLTLANAKFQQLDGLTIIAIIFYCLLQTALAEEIFFRGFLTKRFIAKWGFVKGNVLQALLFGLLHGLLTFSATGNIFVWLLIILFPTAVGFAFGYLNERVADGSIIPSWLIHAGANLFSTLLVVFHLY